MADTADEVIEYSAESLLRCIWQLLALSGQTDPLSLSAVGVWSQPIDATPILNSKDRDYVLMSEKCRQGLTAAEKSELWHRWQPGILKAIRQAFGKRYAGVASTG
jgi:hypothetical protein